MINPNTDLDANSQGNAFSGLLQKFFFTLLFLMLTAGGLYLAFLFLSTMRVIIIARSEPLAESHGTMLPVSEAEAATQAQEAAAKLDVPPPPVWDEGRVNILLLGVDQRACEDTNGIWRTDTMILGSLDPDTKTASMLSFPRDLWVDIPTVGANRLNAAHFFGDAYNYPGGGPALAKRTFHENFLVPVHYYVRINFDGFQKAVDALGGIDIEVEEPIWDDHYPTDDCGYQTVQFDAGLHHMNGEEALKYARSRHYSSDFNRARRQQQVLFAIYDKAMSLQTIPRLPELWAAKDEMVQTDLSLLDAMKLTRLGIQVDRENIHRGMIDESMTENVITDQGWQVLHWDREKVNALIQDLFGTVVSSTDQSPSS